MRKIDTELLGGWLHQIVELSEEEEVDGYMSDQRVNEQVFVTPFDSYSF